LAAAITTIKVVNLPKILNPGEISGKLQKYYSQPWNQYASMGICTPSLHSASN